MGDNLDDTRKKKTVELKAVEVLVPHFNHVDSKNQGKVIWTIWQVILGFVVFSKLKDMLVPFLVDVSFTAFPEVQGKKDFIIANGVPVLVPMLDLSDTKLTLMVMVVSYYFNY